MAGNNSRVAWGLEGVVVAETRLSRVDGQRGELVLAGESVEAIRGPYERLARRLFNSELDEQELSHRIGWARARAFERLDTLGTALATPSAMSALRAAISHLSEPKGADGVDVATDLIGAVGLFSTAWARVQQGRAPVAPDPSLGHAADILRMLRAEHASSEEAQALDAYLVTVADHGMNASTFAARVVASTGSDMVSAVAAAIGALKGPLHGGAPGPVLDMLDAIGSPERARPWLEDELEQGRRIMGMGHRVYRVRDPRAKVLERALDALPEPSNDARAARRKLARTVEREAEALLAQRYPDRPLRANVEFYTAVLLEALEVPRELFSAMFATSRVAGWTAHVLEHRKTGRLIRPLARYVGEEPPVPSAHAS